LESYQKAFSYVKHFFQPVATSIQKVKAAIISYGGRATFFRHRAIAIGVLQSPPTMRVDEPSNRRFAGGDA
jgi:hypothetical protein